jgi:hypothetical protein
VHKRAHGIRWRADWGVEGSWYEPVVLENTETGAGEEGAGRQELERGGGGDALKVSRHHCMEGRCRGQQTNRHRLMMCQVGTEA